MNELLIQKANELKHPHPHKEVETETFTNCPTHLHTQTTYSSFPTKFYRQTAAFILGYYLTHISDQTKQIPEQRWILSRASSSGIQRTGCKYYFNAEPLLVTEKEGATHSTAQAQEHQQHYSRCVNSEDPL